MAAVWEWLTGVGGGVEYEYEYRVAEYEYRVAEYQRLRKVPPNAFGRCHPSSASPL